MAINGALSVQARRWVRRKEKFFIAQGGKCWLCGKPMRKGGDKDHPEFATWDHIVPKSKGGTRSVHNLMLAHRRCNWRRGNSQEVRTIDLAADGIL